MKTVVWAVLISCLFVHEAIALNVDPSRYEMLASQRGKGKGIYTVTNDTDKTVTVSVSTRDWFVLAENKQYPCDTWLKIYKDTLVLKPGESKPLKFKVTVPKGAKGSLFAMISFTTKSPGSDMLSVVISVPVFVIVRGTERYEAGIGKIQFSKDGENVQVFVDVKNNGNVHLRPQGSCILKSKDNTAIEIPIPEARPVYPGKSRVAVGSVSSDVVSSGDYSVHVNLQAAGLLLTATAQVTIDGDKNVRINQ